MKKITDKDIYFAIDERIDRVVEQLEDKFDACCQCIDKNNKKISLLNDLGKLESSKLKDLDTLLINMIDVLENRIKYLEEVDKSYKSDIDDLNEKIDNYEPKNIIKALEVTAETIVKDKIDRLKKDWILKLNDMDKILLNRIECLEDKSTKSFYETDRILSRIEDLEAFKKRAEIIISKLVDKNDDLIEYNNNKESKEKDITQDDFNNMMKEGHETLKRVKNNKMEGK